MGAVGLGGNRLGACVPIGVVGQDVYSGDRGVLVEGRGVAYRARWVIHAADGDRDLAVEPPFRV